MLQNLQQNKNNIVIDAPILNFPNRKFESINKIGQGSQGSVYLAKSINWGINDQNQYALKCQGNSKDNEIQFIDNLIQYQNQYENSQQNYQPSGLIRIYGRYKWNNQDVFIMEKGEQDLFAFINEQQQLTFQQKVEILIQISQSIQFLHQQQLIHRDIKPENYIKIGNQFKLIDFGLIRGDQRIQMTRNIGTCLFQAPELVEGRQDYSKSVDIWALGCLFYELLTKQPFLKAQTALEVENIIKNIKNNDQYIKNRLNYLINQLDDKKEEIQNLLSKMLNPNDQQRIQINQVIEALKNMVQNIPINQNLVQQNRQLNLPLQKDINIQNGEQFQQGIINNNQQFQQVINQNQNAKQSLQINNNQQIQQVINQNQNAKQPLQINNNQQIQQVINQNQNSLQFQQINIYQQIQQVINQNFQELLQVINNQMNKQQEEIKQIGLNINGQFNQNQLKIIIQEQFNQQQIQNQFPLQDLIKEICQQMQGQFAELKQQTLNQILNQQQQYNEKNQNQFQQINLQSAQTYRQEQEIEKLMIQIKESQGIIISQNTNLFQTQLKEREQNLQDQMKKIKELEIIIQNSDQKLKDEFNKNNKLEEKVKQLELQNQYEQSILKDQIKSHDQIIIEQKNRIKELETIITNQNQNQKITEVSCSNQNLLKFKQDLENKVKDCEKQIQDYQKKNQDQPDQLKIIQSQIQDVKNQLQQSQNGQNLLIQELEGKIQELLKQQIQKDQKNTGLENLQFQQQPRIQIENIEKLFAIIKSLEEAQNQLALQIIQQLNQNNQKLQQFEKLIENINKNNGQKLKNQQFNYKDQKENFQKVNSQQNQQIKDLLINNLGLNKQQNSQIKVKKHNQTLQKTPEYNEKIQDIINQLLKDQNTQGKKKKQEFQPNQFQNNKK